MSDWRETLLAKVEQYYSAKIELHGANAAGVDWNGKESQFNRFNQLLKLIPRNSAYSLNDIGCGYGAVLEVIGSDPLMSSYLGVDLSREMIDAASERYSGHEKVGFVVGAHPNNSADYGIASGIFNVKFETPDNEWLEYILHNLDILNDTSEKGFSFNCLTSYSDRELMRSNLYYADPCYFFDHCKKKYAKNVALLHDYGLYEFTMIVRKP